jgi:glycosyltransferase involved in cell wall biosynthesis
MSEKQPLVSVIMNCYNGEKYLYEAIDSIYAQTYKNWELIFWDNLSTDKSSAIFHKYNDKRLKYFLSEKHTNLSEARVLAINKSKGSVITFLDVDDYWDESILETQVALHEDEKISFSCGNFFITNEGLKRKKKFRRKIPSGKVVEDLLADYTVGLLTLSIKRKAYFDVGGFSLDYHIIGDFDLVVRLALYGNMASFQTPLAFYRRHDSNETVLKTELNLHELKMWYKKNENYFKINHPKALNYFFVSIMYKKYVDSIYSNSFSIVLFREMLSNQPVINILKILIKYLKKIMTWKVLEV